MDVDKRRSDNRVQFRPDHRLVLSFAPLAIITLLSSLEGTSISVALPAIARSLNGSAIEAFWSGTSFLLCSTVFQPIIGSLSDIFGRKPLLYTSLAFFLLGSALGGSALNMTWLLCARSIQGFGGGGVVALTEIVITDLVPLRFRGHYFGILSSMLCIGSVTGPIMGGGFIQSLSWRWIFYITLPFIVGAIVLVALFLDAPQTAKKPIKAQLKRIDYVGTTLFVGSMTSFLIPVTWGGIMYSWASFHTVVPLLIGTVGLIACAVYALRFASNPTIPPVIFQSPTTVVSYVGTIIHGLTIWCVLYYFPLYFEGVKGYSPLLSGVALLPFSFMAAPSAVIVGILITITGRYRWSMWVGGALATLGIALLCILKAQTSVAGWVLLMLPAGLGGGALFPALLFGIQASAHPRHIPIAVAMSSFFRSFGQTLGVAIGGVVFQNRMRENLLLFPKLAPHADEYSKDAAVLVQILQMMPDGDEKQSLRISYTDSLRVVWIMCTALTAGSALLTLFVKEYTMDEGEPNCEELQSSSST
ncbi:major facilitator superfamily domain-containing protein [Aspergillus pseudotamarii]|uniref:Major facilitator superfamily domain-containing protein n=1 Tax=Aspergillus pseudotamarii TaxID=132259 RepID=A0A5N6SPK4_ASPPS|nr:major facilitator superfamily domain-containing protein [Aspergillus pseudotamarii]KAE8135064.1 major facilitator superfamily domain-containing protein [Aspergillus pseudotamarii]